MFLGGLWHGVSLPFMAWGALHGVALALHKVWLTVVPGAKSVGAEMRPVWRMLATLLTLHIVAFGWLLFNSPDMETVNTMIYNITHNFSFAELGELDKLSKVALGVIIAGYILHYMPRSLNDRVRCGVTNLNFVGQLIVVLATIWMVAECNDMLSDYRQAEVVAMESSSVGGEVDANAGLPAYGAF
jgi:type III secretory pathway component EscU